MVEPTLRADHPGPLPSATSPSPRRPSFAKRALIFAKYLPAVLCGLLVVAWGLSLFWEIELLARDGSAYVGLDFENSTIHLWREASENRPKQVFYQYRRIRPHFPHCLGKMSWRDDYSAIAVPVPLLLTAIAPFSIGPFIRFRFPLWSWFAFTAMVAVELAYYLR